MNNPALATMVDFDMQPTHYFSDSLKMYCKGNFDCMIHDWLETLASEDLRKLKHQIEVLVSPIPIGISSLEGFDLNYLAFAAASQIRRKRVVNLPWGKREKVLMEILQSIIIELKVRGARLESLMVDAVMLFGNSGKAKKWMTQYNEAFCGTPISMLNTEIGTDEVRKVLASISYGGAV